MKSCRCVAGIAVAVLLILICSSSHEGAGKPTVNVLTSETQEAIENSRENLDENVVAYVYIYILPEIYPYDDPSDYIVEIESCMKIYGDLSATVRVKATSDGNPRLLGVYEAECCIIELKASLEEGKIVQDTVQYSIHHVGNEINADQFLLLQNR